MNLRIYESTNLGINTGLTLIELLVVMVIMGILATVGFGQYKTSQIKARDAQRKGDLDNIARALEMFYNDNDSYPLSSGDGKIMVASSEINWGGEFNKVYDSQDVVYMKTLPDDPVDDYDYCYESDANGSYFKLYAKLENTNDDDYYEPGYECGGTGAENTYYYGITSSNTSLP